SSRSASSRACCRAAARTSRTATATRTSGAPSPCTAARSPPSPTPSARATSSSAWRVRSSSRCSGGREAMAGTTLELGGRTIGPGHPCFVIAEAGSNHDGRLEQALRLIDVAAEAGADAVKFQLFRAARLYPRGAGQTAYLKLEQSIYDVVAAMEMPYEWLP